MIVMMGMGSQFLLRATIVVSFIFLLSSEIPAATYHLEADGTGDFPTIQVGIDASSDGDVIELADGVYTGSGNRDLDYNGKLICIRSISGNPESCVLDCEGQGRGFYFHSGNNLSARVEGLTIRNGDASYAQDGGMYYSYGGAILCVDGGATFDHCRFVMNTSIIGGAVSLHEGAEVVFQECDFLENTTILGGGLYVDDSQLHMYHSVIRRNHSWGSGGGICNYESDMVLIDVVFSENVAGEEGGGLFNNFTSLLAVDCVFEKNAAGQPGGGVRIGNGRIDVILINCRIRGNSSGDTGGGIYLFHNHGSIDLIGCVVAQNSARSGGGLGVFSESLPIIHDCTILNNRAEQEGGGITVLPVE